jgi:hypothetical protein
MARKPKEQEDPDEPEPKAPADPDAALLRGGPGQDPAEPAAEPEPTPDQPTRARVKIGKKEFEVDPEIADAYAAREREYADGIRMDREARAELDRYRRAAQPTPPKDDEPDLNTLIFENPKKALELHGQQIEARLEARYRTEQAYRAFWETFYKNNPDLEEEDTFVRARFTSIFNDIADQPTGKAQDALADDVRREILRISRKARTSDDTPPPRTRAIVEAPSGDRPPRAQRSEEDDLPTSLSDAIRRKVAARRAAK